LARAGRSRHQRRLAVRRAAKPAIAAFWVFLLFDPVWVAVT
jgi:hypothetical protein